MIMTVFNFIRLEMNLDWLLENRFCLFIYLFWCGKVVELEGYVYSQDIDFIYSIFQLLFFSINFLLWWEFGGGVSDKWPSNMALNILILLCNVLAKTHHQKYIYFFNATFILYAGYILNLTDCQRGLFGCFSIFIIVSCIFHILLFDSGFGGGGC